MKAKWFKSNFVNGRSNGLHDVYAIMLGGSRGHDPLDG